MAKQDQCNELKDVCKEGQQKKKKEDLRFALIQVHSGLEALGNGGEDTPLKVSKHRTSNTKCMSTLNIERLIRKNWVG
jgi:hypothetical protein